MTQPQVTEWGPYRLIPHSLAKDPTYCKLGESCESELAAADWWTDSRVARFPNLASVTSVLRRAVKIPNTLPFVDGTVTGVWTLAQPGDAYAAVQMFWHRPGNPSPRTADLRVTADLRLVRVFGRVTPVDVLYLAPPEPDAAVTQWDIEPIRVGGREGLYHRFTINPLVNQVTQRAWVEADAVEWFDAEGAQNICYGWKLTLAELLGTAESLQ